MLIGLQKAFAAVLLVVLGVAVFCAGFLRVIGPANGYAFGVICALLSALAWTASTVTLTTLLNLFAALFAAVSAGFLAPPAQVCAWQHLPLLCP